MGKLVVTEFVSVDGVFEDPGGSEDYEHGGWTFEYDRDKDGDESSRPRSRTPNGRTRR
jgi:hypothetical protein